MLEKFCEIVWRSSLLRYHEWITIPCLVTMCQEEEAYLHQQTSSIIYPSLKIYFRVTHFINLYLSLSLSSSLVWSYVIITLRNV